MKTLKYSLLIVVVNIVLSMTSQAQEAITGTLLNYTIGEGVLISHDMISNKIIPIGNIDPKGNFKIPLDKNYLKTIKQQAEKAKAQAPKAWQMNFKTVATTFECFGGALEYKNANALLIGIPDPEIRDPKLKIEQGVLFAVSQVEMAQWLYSYGQKPLVKGYYLQWFFAEDEASSKGECVLPTYTGNGDENYNAITSTNVELQKGWNIIKYAITDVFTDANGKTAPSKTEISTITEIPKDIKWIRINE